MHESVGTPSICTVHAPQWPTLHAIFVPVKPIVSRRSCASDVPTGASSSYSAPFTVRRSSGTGRHRGDVGQVDQAECCPSDQSRVRFVLGLRQRAPQVPCSKEQLANLLEL